MSRFTLGLVCGFVSAFVTWWVARDAELAAVVGGFVVVAVWLLGGVLLAVFGD